MGKKQTALVATVLADELACHHCIADLKTACAEVLVVNQKIEATQDYKAQAKFQLERNTPLGDVLKARAKLTPLLDTYGNSIKKLETFINEKSKRWVGKSTLGQAKTYLANAKAVQKDYQDIVAASKLI